MKATLVWISAGLALGWLGCAASKSPGSNGTGGTPGGLGTGATAAPATGGSGAPVGGSGGSSATGGSGGGVTGGTGGGAGGAIATGGMGGGVTGGTGGGMTGGMGGGMTGGMGGGAGAGPVTYPMLDGAMIGSPAELSTGVTLTLAEGPVWDPCTHKMLFVDVQGAGNTGVIYAMGADDQASVLKMGTSNTNGIAWDRTDGSLVLAQMGGAPGHVARMDRSGTITVIPTTGGTLHTPDDVIVRSDGTIYFTDGDFPPIGGIDLGQLPVYAIKAGTTALLNGGTVQGPNGIQLSPDEKTLYVDEYFGGNVIKFTVADDGTLTKGSAVASGLASPDSLCIDAAGNLYVGVSTGLQVLRPDGSMVKLIPVSGVQGVTNCGFGGDDGKTLYITAWTKVLKVTGMPIPGLEWTMNQSLTCS